MLTPRFAGWIQILHCLDQSFLEYEGSQLSLSFSMVWGKTVVISWAMLAATKWCKCTSWNDVAVCDIKTTKALVKIPAERIENAILLIRGEKLILDSDLAALYGVETRALLQAVKRNRERFPSDFMIQLTLKESDSLRSQIVISKGRGGRRYLPYAFSEHGAIMAASVLNSKTAVETSVQVVRAFVRLRQMLASNKELAHKLIELERRYDTQFKVVFDAIRELMTTPEPKRKQIGFAKTSKK
jgi:hypothetical protein